MTSEHSDFNLENPEALERAKYIVAYCIIGVHLVVSKEILIQMIAEAIAKGEL